MMISEGIEMNFNLLNIGSEIWKRFLNFNMLIPSWHLFAQRLQ